MRQRLLDGPRVSGTFQAESGIAPAAECIESPYDVESRVPSQTRTPMDRLHGPRQRKHWSRPRPTCSPTSNRPPLRSMKRSAPRPSSRHVGRQGPVPARAPGRCSLCQSELLVQSRDDQGILLRGPRVQARAADPGGGAYTIDQLPSTGSSRCAAPRPPVSGVVGAWGWPG